MVMERYKLSDLFKNQHLISKLSRFDIIDVDMFESDFYLSRKSESFINHTGEKDALIKLLSDCAFELNCEIRQMHQIDNKYMDCLTFVPLKDEINKSKNFIFPNGCELNYIPIDLQISDGFKNEK
jgi:hypothetical protein